MSPWRNNIENTQYTEAADFSMVDPMNRATPQDLFQSSICTV